MKNIEEFRKEVEQYDDDEIQRRVRIARENPIETGMNLIAKVIRALCFQERRRRGLPNETHSQVTGSNKRGPKGY